MGILSKMFGKKVNEGKSELAKIENRDLMEAIVAGSMLVAYADGECEEAEMKSLEKVISSLPELKHFGSEIHDTIETFRQQFETGFRIGKQKAMKEIEDLKAIPEEKELCFNVMITIAESDGEVEPQEMVILKEVASKLGLRLQDYGLENA